MDMKINLSLSAMYVKCGPRFFFFFVVTGV